MAEKVSTMVSAVDMGSSTGVGPPFMSVEMEEFPDVVSQSPMIFWIRAAAFCWFSVPFLFTRDRNSRACLEDLA
ncbi:hypothetical protein OG936_34080 [Streptomyces sp. NBC_00846]|uniref:hypothetical protein n=1 Tax=Streptomyces sp. NBC_00846 TaxID=2975849 RepID=UPI00386F71BD|nr:hypothetical protein OG936_34080 [Streptomyces sp. NBC_00846]